MSYEIPLPMPERLQAKPIVNALELHRYLEQEGFKPLAVAVDNIEAKVTVYLETALTANEGRRLEEKVLEWYRRHIGVERGG